MRAATTFLALVIVFLTTNALAEGITKKQVEGLYRTAGKLYNKGELRDVSRLYHSDFEFIDNVSLQKPVRHNLVSYFKEGVALQARVARWKFVYEIQSIEVSPDGMSAEVVSIHTNTMEGNGRSQTSRTVQKSTIVNSASGPLFRRTEVVESQLLSGGA